MSLWRLIWQSLRFHSRAQLALALGVAAATAVLTGALLVGDSVRGSLKDLALDRLGKIDQLLVVDRFFQTELAERLRSSPEFTARYAAATPAVLYPTGVAESVKDQQTTRAAGVLVLGVEEAFWSLGDAAIKPQHSLQAGEIILNQTLADELQAKVGESIILRLPSNTQVPADSPLGKKTGRTTGIPDLKVVQIIPARSLARFTLEPTQTSPRVAFVSLATLQDGLDVAGKANAIFVQNKPEFAAVDPAEGKTLSPLLSPTAADLGLKLTHVRRVFSPPVKAGEKPSQESPAGEEEIFNYFSISSERMMLEEAAESELLKTFADNQPQAILTYLANSMSRVVPAGEAPPPADALPRKPIPYSTITALEPAVGGPLVDEAGKLIEPLAEDEIVLTRWAADDQKAQVGDSVRVEFFLPETTHGNAREASARFKVKAIVPLTEPYAAYNRKKPALYNQRPTGANDPDLTPEVQGITDQASMSNWKPPFPYDYTRIRPQDDTFWENHRTTPKAFISLTAGKKYFGSRFGSATSIRIPAKPELTVATIEQRLLTQLKADQIRLGYDFISIKAQSLRASSGTTPFDVLFLLLSMFIIAAALMLVWLLVRLGVEQRVSEIGLLLALGWNRPRIIRWLTGEGLLVALAGSLLGVLLGVGYAWLMVAGLRSWWVGAIATPFLEFHASSLSLLIGYFSGVLTSVLTIYFSLRGLPLVAIRKLLAGEAPQGAAQISAAGKTRATWLRLVILSSLLIAAVGLALLGTKLGGEAQAGAFLSSGAAILTTLLFSLAQVLTPPAITPRPVQTSLPFATRSLLALSWRNMGRSRGRSLATIALMAVAAFLIVAVSSFRLDPTDEGVGGFDFIAESSQPILGDLNVLADRKELLGNEAAEKLSKTVLFAFRLQPGDDASCRNLYQAVQPRVLGVTSGLAQYYDDTARTHFAFAGTAAQTDAEKINPWHLLDKATPAGQPVPIFLDKNTAMYSLRLYQGVGEEFSVTYPDGQTIRFKVAGLLGGCVLQGCLIVGEADFKRLFPQVSGYRLFLMKVIPGKDLPTAAEAANILETKLSDEGFDCTNARERLADLLAVQNTYISTFQTLGALGLLLGTFGLAAVQLRNVLERRKELAMLRAIGFGGTRIAQMVLLENALLLLAGLVVGAVSALLAVVPHMLSGGARVPLLDLSLMLLCVLIVGLASGLWAARATLRAPLLKALRGE